MILLLAAILAAGAAEPGLKLLREGRAAEAADSFAAALRKDPRNAALANDLGLANARAGRREEAEKSYRLAIQLLPRRWLAYGNLADLLSTADDRWERADETLALLERGLSLASGEGKSSLWLRIAGFEASVGRTAQARRRLAALEQLEPGAEVMRRVRELLDRIAEEERARALEDWPEPAPSPAQRDGLGQAERKLLAGDARGALAAAEALCAAQPAWRPARWLKVRALEGMGRLDEEARELRVLTQLAPTDAAAWRALGQVLAEHGGVLEVERADAALREALALEPSWTGLWLLRARLALRQGRAKDALRHLDRYQRSGGTSAEAARLSSAARAQADLDPQAPAPAVAPAREPSAAARALLQQAAGADSPQGARELLTQAVDDSPAFVEAAAALYALGGSVPEKTLLALQDDGPGLLELSARVRRAGGAAALVAPWIDRAVQAGAPEARFARAQLRLDQGDREGALSDLLAYAASPEPQHLEEARTLRALLVSPSHGEIALVQARRRLAEDRPEAALAVLGERCEPQMTAGRLVAIGEVREFSGDLARALECYRLASPSPLALRRLARVSERNPDPRAADELRAAAALGIAEAHWALARIDLAAGRQDAALANLERFLADAPPDDPGGAEARAARDSILQTSTAAARARARIRAAVAGGAALLLAAIAAWLWAGATLQSALRRAPRLFPQVARAVNEVRHDVIKHRAGVLGMLADPGSREDVARALLAPEPASQVVSRHYAALRKAARAQGVTLRRLGREPVFGPLFRDLARAEALLRQPGAGTAELARLDERIRLQHAERLGALLRLGPRTRLDASAVAGWIRDVEAETRRGGASWTAPSILMKGMEVEFPVERGALSTIFANLLRNAQAAAGGGEVIVRLGEERDAAGRNLMVLLVGDSSEHAISLDAIERRESGRGLGLVRDLTREWQGHVVVRPEEPPWKKAVGACFPAPPA
jgi:tetratricopeptide (TPR) repeat protein